MIETGTLQPRPTLVDRLPTPAPSAPPKPSHERGEHRRARRHQERLVANWLRSLTHQRP